LRDRQVPRNQRWRSFRQIARWLGRVALAQGRAGDAVPLIERAVKLREKGESPPSEIAVAQFLLAQALWESKQERTRAIDLAKQARAGSQDDDPTYLAEIDAWLAEHEQAP
jgi:eukaryotic-like serine/threonine-protein kinase